MHVLTFKMLTCCILYYIYFVNFSWQKIFIIKVELYIIIYSILYSANKPMKNIIIYLYISWMSISY